MNKRTSFETIVPFLFFFLLLSFIISAQQSKVDSLQMTLSGAKEDSNKVKILNELSREINMLGYYLKSDSVAHDALKLSERINFKTGIVDSYNNLGDNHYYINDYLTSLEYFYNAQKISKEIGYKDGIAFSYYGIGQIYQDEGDDSSALIQEQESFILYEQTGNKDGMASSLEVIGWIYDDWQNDSIAIIKEGKALKLYTEMNDKAGIASSLDLIGKIYENKMNWPLALQKYTEALAIKKEIGNNDGITTSLVEIAEIYFKQGKLTTALEYTNRSLALAHEINSIEDIKDAEKTLSDIYIAMNSLQEGMKHFKNYVTIQDSIYGPRNTKKLVRSEMSHEFELKQALEKAEQDKKDTEYKIGVVVLLIVIIALMIILFLYRKNIEQKNIISEKNKEIAMRDIENGENEKVEFKSTLRWNIKANIVDRETELWVGKTIAGFLNSTGGRLYIGVNDEKTILGLENDFNTFNKKDDKKDAFRLHFDNLMGTYFGNHISNLLILKLIEFDDKTIAVVNVPRKASRPVYLNNGKDQIFYVRRTGSTKALLIEEAVKYIEHNWG